MWLLGLTACLWLAGTSSVAIAQTDSATVQRLLERANDFIKNSKQDSARIYVEQAMVTENEDQRAEALRLMGTIELSGGGSLDLAAKYFLQSLDLYTQMGDREGMKNCYLQLGVLQHDLKNYQAAIDQLENASDSSDYGTYRSAVVHYLIALSYSELRQFDKAEKRFQAAIEEVGDRYDFFLVQIESFRGKMFTNQGDPQRTIRHLQALKDNYRDLIEEESYGPVSTFLSTAYLEAGEYQKAITHGRAALVYLEDLGSGGYYLRETQATMHKAFAAIGNSDSAYFYLRTLSEHKDSMYNDQVLQKVAELNGQFEFDQAMRDKQAEQAVKDAIAEEELKQERITRNFLIGAFLVVFMIAILFLRQRNRISVEKKRSDHLLLNILPEQIAEELKSKGKAEARDFLDASILFTDFAHFTEAAEKLNAKDLVEEINVCFEAFDGICDTYGIEKIKTIGDAYMAAGGLPVPSPESAGNTLMAAIEMQAFITNRKTQNLAKNAGAFEMRVGIHTGHVVAGIVGVKKFQYDIWGDTVNTAHRMESHGEVGKVNISQSTYALLKDDKRFAFEQRGAMDVKGKGEMTMWFVHRSQQDATA